jgi:hypothetical protein
MYADMNLISFDDRLETVARSRWSIVPAVAFVRANAGGDRFAYLDPEYEDPLPEMNRFSASFRVARVLGPREKLSLYAVYEREDWVVERHSDKFGGELGIANAFFARIGHIKEIDWRKLTTYGAGFSFAGLYDWIKGGTATASSGFWDRLDIRFDYARYGNDRTQGEEKTSFFGLGFSISE